MRNKISVLAILFCAIAPIAAHADTYNVAYDFPNLGSVYEDHGTATSGNFYGDINYVLTPTSLTLTSSESANNFYNPAAFNGIVLTDLGGPNPINGVTLDPASIDPSAVTISFIGNTVDFNFSGSAFDKDIVEIFDFTTAGSTSATPEPSSLILLGTGALGLAGSVRRRFTRKA